VIIIFGSNATLNAGQKGGIFYGNCSKGKTSLELHDITLKNGKGNSASHVRAVTTFRSCSAEFP
jgi:hypothetical protein